jgi:hypothetical protein
VNITPKARAPLNLEA